MLMIFYLFLLYSFLGWIHEMLFTFICTKKLINRGFLIGPWCPIYGICGVAITSLCDLFPGNVVYTFFISTLLCSLIEYFISFLLEKLFHARWWDYSHLRYNLNGRICILYSLAFGAMAVVLNFLKTSFVLFLSKLPNVFLISCSILFCVDCLLSFFMIRKINFSMEGKKDNTEEISRTIFLMLLKVKKKILK